MKLWDKGYSIDEWVESFTVGKDSELDLVLARWDVLGSLAHGKMLHSIGLLNEKEWRRLEKGLQEILEEISEDKFSIDRGVEDVHSQVELLLTHRLGEIGKKIHSGRSRNDQVLVDLRLFFRSEIQELFELSIALFNSFMAQAEKHKDILMPGYTHMQVAMPSSFGLWFSAYGESLIEDLMVLQTAWKICNQNPLGSAAGYGSSFPLDREMTTHLLGFDDLSYNSIAAQMGRGKTERTLAFAMSSLAATVGKFAMDVCLYSGQDFRFVSLPKELTTGSSIMPHKANPDVFEILRGRCNLIQALPNSLSLLLANLPAGYHRELQLLKEEIFPRISDLKNCLGMCKYALDKITINTSLISEEKYNDLFTVEEVNRLVVEGMPFRDAYQTVAKKIKDGSYSPNKEISHSHLGSIGNLALDGIRSKLDRVKDEFNFDEVNEALEKLAR